MPTDVDHVLNFAVAKTGDFDKDLAANVEAVGMLMHHCRDAKAFLHCSSTAVYEPNGHHDFAEGDPLGDNHRRSASCRRTRITKIAAEAMARYGARQWDLPTTIARLIGAVRRQRRVARLPLRDDAGRPARAVHEDAPSEYNPIHEDDIVA